VLLHVPHVRHEWRCSSQFFGSREVASFSRPDSFDITNFEVDDVEALRNAVKDDAEVVDELETPRGARTRS
jgi:hypothetical protein